MIIDLPQTGTTAINTKMLEIRDGTGTILNRVMNLVVMVGRDENLERVVDTAKEATREHPCRVLVLVNGDGRGAARLDAQIRVGGDAGASEIIVLRMSGELTKHADAVVLALLLPDTPVVAWWPGDGPDDPASDPIGRLAHRRMVDAAKSPRPVAKLYKRAPFDTPEDTDLGWARLTRWRSVLAAALDQPPYEKVTEVTVTGSPDSPSNELLAGWLGMKLKCPVTVVPVEKGKGVVGVKLTRPNGASLEVMRPKGDIAVLSVEGRPDQRVSLARRADRDAIAEELRRLDPDDVYAEVVKKGLPLVTSGSKMSLAAAERRGQVTSSREASRRVRSAGAKQPPGAKRSSAEDPSS